MITELITNISKSGNGSILVKVYKGFVIKNQEISGVNEKAKIEMSSKRKVVVSLKADLRP